MPFNYPMKVSLNALRPSAMKKYMMEKTMQISAITSYVILKPTEAYRGAPNMGPSTWPSPQKVFKSAPV